MKKLLSVIFVFVITICAGAISVSADDISLNTLIAEAAAAGQTTVDIPPGATLVSEQVTINTPGLTINGNGA
ncbi:MAG: hypothetical protein LBL80_05395, partial [Ruminococcus sp.]|nr:hypothetical protein [Ruminococcus sp.]